MKWTLGPVGREYNEIVLILHESNDKWMHNEIIGLSVHV